MAASTTAGAGAAVLSFLLLLVSLQAPLASSAHNITAILAAFPEYSAYNGYLTKTKVADEVNSRETVTSLVLPNPSMKALAANRPLSAVKSALRLLTLLDYYDAAKLHDISDGSVLTTTLLQTTGNADGKLGFVNITDLKGGRVGFGASSTGAKLDSVYTRSVKQMPFSISVLEISAPIVFPGLLDAPAKDTANITGLLVKAGCKTFASLISSSGVLKIYQDAMDTGLTVFAPDDAAFKAADVPDMTALSQAELVTLLQYHAIPRYTPKTTLKTAKDKVSTLATNGVGNYSLRVTSSGDDVTLRTGLGTSRVASTVIDDTPFCILTVDKLLLPVELFGKAPSPAPGMAPSPAPELPEPPAPELPEPPAEGVVEAKSPGKAADAEVKDVSLAAALTTSIGVTILAAAVSAFALCGC